MAVDIGANLACAIALHRTGLLEGTRLPSLATWLLSNGLESESIVKLASLDLQPFFSIDAQELFDDVIIELRPDEPREDILVTSIGCVCRLILNGDLDSPAAMSIGSRLATTNDYPSSPSGIMDLYSLEDEWGAGWGRGREQITADIREIARENLEPSEVATAADIEFLRMALAVAQAA